MSPDQIRLVQESVRLALPIAATVASLFYARLFALEPALRRLFAHAGMAEQGRKLMAAIGVVVASLPTPEAMLPTVRDLARRHAGYGVRAEHYATVGAALLWTLERGLGEAFTPETRDAWAAAYGLLSGAMIEAAAGFGRAVA